MLNLFWHVCFLWAGVWSVWKLGMSVWMPHWSEGKENRSSWAWVLADRRQTARLYTWLWHTGVCCCLHLCFTLHERKLTADPGSAFSHLYIFTVISKTDPESTFLILFDIINLDLWPRGACMCEWYADNGSLIDSEECEEAYGDLLSLCEATKQPNAGAAHSLNYSSCGAWTH